MAYYANIIIDISTGKLDRTFQYRIPEELFAQIYPGVQVNIPFGKNNRMVSGFVIEVTDQAEYDEKKLKEIDSVASDLVIVETQLIALAVWMRKNYGGTMNQALKTVLPIKRKIKNKEKKTIVLTTDREQVEKELAIYQQKRTYKARKRLLEAILESPEISYEVITQRLNISAKVIRFFEDAGMIKVVSEAAYRNPIGQLDNRGYHKKLNEMQQHVVDEIRKDMQEDIHKTYLLHGVTGSGKTEVYMELIADVIEKGQQAIVLIPEIALTYQTVIRFYGRFADRVSIINSKLASGERYDQFLRAKNGEIDIMIGPRSALFTPFQNLGLIIIDEEHESSYKSETIPKYHARETAIERAKMTGASVVLGSATPSVDSYYKALKGEYQLLEMKERVAKRELPVCEVVDMRKELYKGNRSILSETLEALIEDRLYKKEQVMLFINRRGMSGFVSCRSCGYVIKCPHCDVSLSLHKNRKMVCHYCGYEEDIVKDCPKCKSKYLGSFKAGTQKVEQVIQKRYPRARILRMDYDTTRGKNSYEEILSAFSSHDADILIGTQMIVKGHDFPDVTLVGILAADMSLYVNDYRAAERTFQLLTQAAGRAGRGNEAGEVVIQTYTPKHYSIQTAQMQDYKAFYNHEMAIRKMLSYPPVANMAAILFTSEAEELSEKTAAYIAALIQKAQIPGLTMIGPADGRISKIHDIYRKVIYLKHDDYAQLVDLKDRIELFLKKRGDFTKVNITFDFNPMSGL